MRQMKILIRLRESESSMGARQKVRFLTYPIGYSKTGVQQNVIYITKTYLYNFDPLKPLYYSKTGVYRGIDYFLISAQKHRLWVLVRTALPTHNLCFSRNKKNIRYFLSENFQFLEVKFSIYLNRRVFVMTDSIGSCDVSLTWKRTSSQISHIFLNWSCIRMKARFRASQTSSNGINTPGKIPPLSQEDKCYDFWSLSEPKL